VRTDARACSWLRPNTLRRSTTKNTAHTATDPGNAATFIHRLNRRRQNESIQRQGSLHSAPAAPTSSLPDKCYVTSQEHSIVNPKSPLEQTGANRWKSRYHKSMRQELRTAGNGRWARTSNNNILKPPSAKHTRTQPPTASAVIFSFLVGGSAYRIESRHTSPYYFDWTAGVNCVASLADAAGRHGLIPVLPSSSSCTYSTLIPQC
jgi:hypothetical protein